MNNKKSLILSVIGILGLIVITVGITFAFFSYAKEGTTDNTITTGTITFLYTEVSGVGKGISLIDSYPINDSQGKSLTGEGKVFDFKVTSTNNINASIPYEITTRKKDTSTLDEEAVKIYLTKVIGTNEEEVLLSKYSDLTQTKRVTEDKYTEKTIYIGKVPATSENYEQAYRLRMWIDEGTDFSPVEDDKGNIIYPYNNKEFTITVNVYANAKVVTEEDKELEKNNEISSIKVGEKTAVEAYSNSYDYEIGLVSGTTSTSLNIETESLDTEVSIESLDSLAYTSSVKRLSATKNVNVSEGDNYFKITTTSLTGEKKESIINIRVGEYKESLLNDTDPILSNSLIPVVIKDNGEVYKVDTNYTWYDYETKYWANAVVLRNTDTYKVGELIPEYAIESYFVWIPKYSYQLWDLGNYSSHTTIEKKEHIIPIKFGLTNTSDTIIGECTTPGVAGESGKCQAGDYMTHPAFLAFNTNGFWVGKYETGYDGATSTSESQTNTNKFDISKIIIKPNVYSWRGITLGNAFKNSYEYLRNEESHMMKNTEWGAVAYLSHSLYGTCAANECNEVIINNNSSYLTGYLATETNYTAIYDMSGGAWEFIMGYNTSANTEGGLSNLTTLYNDFFTSNKWDKYYDKYTTAKNTDFNNRILGDATGELGPFNIVSSNISSWYGDYSYYIHLNNPWFNRGGYWDTGTGAGIFAFSNRTGEIGSNISFRIVLAPTK